MFRRQRLNKHCKNYNYGPNKIKTTGLYFGRHFRSNELTEKLHITKLLHDEPTQ